MSTAPQPGGRAPAPGSLALVQDFLNTADLEAGRDMLDADHFSAWASQHALDPTEPTRLRVVALRESLRDWIAAGQSEPTAGAAEHINSLDLTLGVFDGRLRLTAHSEPGRALAPVIDAVRTALDDGTWPRLKSCDRKLCRWVYYDHSKNAGSHWCATSICGSREKARRAYARRTRQQSERTAE